jgi:enamine deaminase RidA (YjgF/YER057c/UK114 family)
MPAAVATGSEFSFTVKPLRGERIINAFERLFVMARNAEATIISLTIFGSVRAQPAAEEAMRHVFRRINWPVTWVEGASDNDQPIAGIQAFAFTDGKSTPVILHGRVVGSVFEEAGIRHCLLGDLRPQDCSIPRPDQFRQTLENVNDALASAGFSFGDVVRTWFFLDKLLSWYDDFNQIRTQAYDAIKFRTGSLPASTGISGRNPAGSALVVGIWAMQPLNDSVRIREVPSPLQCPAPAYGSSFSRAMEISSPAGRRLLISGTASIAPEGRTLWPESLGRQIEQTMAVVEAILTSRGFALPHLTRATAYLKHRADIPAFEAWRGGWGLHPLSVITTHCGVCRDDLLFELEADAWQPSPA